jgi:hypothetical protein
LYIVYRINGACEKCNGKLPNGYGENNPWDKDGRLKLWAKDALKKARSLQGYGDTTPGVGSASEQI